MSNYTNELEQIENHLAEHRAFLDKYYALNRFICSGAQNPRTGGVILCKADSKAEVEKIVLEDPFHIHGAATYHIIEFNPTKFAPAFESLV
ncbi:MAG: YciI family protein [Paludibacter sp.]|nr:YciI family protein [Paludibacter sp.]